MSDIRNIKKPTYQKMFWLFIAGSLLGVLIEGVWYYFMHGHWETHVVSIWGDFCIIYGLGAVGYYIGNYAMQGKNIFLRFIVFMLIGTGVEFICGIVLKYCLNMRAWTYKGYAFSFMDMICLKMAVIWGIAGILFGYLIPGIDKMLTLTEGRTMDIVCVIFSVFMTVNFILTGICLVRWKQRRENVPPQNSFFSRIDEKYGDDYMKQRFIEWRFLS